MKVNLMIDFFENCDRYGASEWFERMCNAVDKQDECVRLIYTDGVANKDMHELNMDTYRMIAASSMMHLVRDYREFVRQALLKER